MICSGEIVKIRADLERDVIGPNADRYGTAAECRLLLAALDEALAREKRLREALTLIATPGTAEPHLVAYRALAATEPDHE